jgi:hypothetical protein
MMVNNIRDWETWPNHLYKPPGQAKKNAFIR